MFHQWQVFHFPFSNFPFLIFGNYPISAISAISFAPPPRLFSTSTANKSASANRRLHHAWATLAWPLGDAWVTQGWPKPNPNQAEGRNRARYQAAGRIGAPDQAEGCNGARNQAEGRNSAPSRYKYQVLTTKYRPSATC